MRRLSNKILSNITGSQIALPPLNHTQLPVKVLQFGAGVLLRGLPDYLIDKANRAGIFNGRVAIVKSTEQGDIKAFADQDNLYTLLVKGIENRELVEEVIINSSISHILSAAQQWHLVLKESENPHLKIIISNTTDVGIQLIREDIGQHPPASFPAKLLAVLHHRYLKFNGDTEKGLVVIPTELLPDNAGKLKSILIDLVEFNKLENGFVKWLDESNYFCNSLVDRIVPGSPDNTEKQLLAEKYGYLDELLIISEPYHLWAIEGNETVKEVLSFEQADNNMIVVPDIENYRELKLKLLNGTHTLSCALALLSGYDFVKDAAGDTRFVIFLENLTSEIRAAMPDVDPKQLKEFCDDVLDRFRNPYIEHAWVNIAQQYTTKIITRVLPIITSYYKISGIIADNIAKGLAGYIFFINSLNEGNGVYYFDYKGVKHPIKDDKVKKLIEISKSLPADQVVLPIFKCEEVWGQDISQFTGLVDAVQYYLDEITNGKLSLI